MMRAGFSRPKKWNPLSPLIMWWLGTNYSHTFLVTVVGDYEIVFQANRHGVHVLLFSEFEKGNTIVDLLQVAPERQKEATDFCMKYLGRPYSTLSILSIAARIAYGDGKKGFTCSELLARALGLEGVPLDRATPRDVRRLLLG